MHTAVITGGAGGMGLATARLMGADHRLVLLDLSQEALDAAVAELAASGLEARGVAVDITDRAAVAEALQDVEAEAGVRAVVHAAGLSPSMGHPERIIRVNAIGTVNVAEAFAEVVPPGGALVNVASVAGHMLPRVLIPRRVFWQVDTDPEELAARLLKRANRGPSGGRSGTAYSLSKAFVIWYSAHLAARFGEREARVVSVSPGSFDTDMGRLEEGSGSAALVEHGALKRFGGPEEIAAVLAFCASEAPGYLTGTDILCDGGVKAGMTLRAMIEMARA